MDETDKKILNLIQTDFPIHAAPYAEIGREVGIAEDEAFGRVKALFDSGIIRRIGASFDSRGLGWTSTLCAVSVPPEKIEQVAAVVGEYPGVTHNYERNHRFNLWFTYIAPDEKAVEAMIEEVARRTGYAAHNLPMIRKFKIKVDFKFKENAEDNSGEAEE